MALTEIVVLTVSQSQISGMAQRRQQSKCQEVALKRSHSGKIWMKMARERLPVPEDLTMNPGRPLPELGYCP